MVENNNGLKINIVSFNIPYPADYGGVIDVFYKIKSLYKLGVDITLHAFMYGRDEAKELDKYCSKIYYYKRTTGLNAQFSFLPYIVNSRKNQELLKNLQQNNYPILFEGIHTCYYLNHPSLKDRVKIVRMHNVEYKYYNGLAKRAKGIYNKIYFYMEAVKLKRFEPLVVEHADYILPLSDIESDYFREKYDKDKIVFVPVFHQSESINIKEKITDPYLVFHGDLSVSENINSAIYLIENIAVNKDLKLVIAGKNPTEILIKITEQYTNVILIPNPDNNKMQELIQNAAINILYVKQGAGVKLKLLYSLYNGRFCFANAAMLEGSMVNDLCIQMPDDRVKLLETIHQYYHKDFDNKEIDRRSKLLNCLYDNNMNARKIVNLLE